MTFRFVSLYCAAALIFVERINGNTQRRYMCESVIAHTQLQRNLILMRSYPAISGKIHYVARARKSARRVSHKSHINFRRDVRVNDATLVTSFVRGIQRDKSHALLVLREPFNFTAFRHTGRRRRNVVHARLPFGEQLLFARMLSTRRSAS